MPATAQHEAQRVAAVRRFNRFYTQHLGVLNDGFLDSPFSLTQARVLYEIRERHSSTATDIGRDLGLDAGYLSRLLAQFEKSRLIRKERSPSDGRQSFLSITAMGRKAMDHLERRTVRQVGDVLHRLSDPEQDRLVQAMRSVERMMALASKTESEIVLREPRPGDLGWIVARHATLYLQEYGWAGNFEAICAQIVADFGMKFDPARERCWIAEMNGENVGSVFLVKDTDEIARLRLLLVDPVARGRGLGTRLTAECVRFAQARGYRRITLWTHSILTPARHIYAKAGFTLTSSEKKKSFGKDVVSEIWDLRF
ncbi:bifunctional helix-turn-helix transcriptional regulator/GNAT family N-acetyltransferase [Rhodoplanes sp. Z2-YC6860]|uniref:bifunctional helix-turn-helix transcriptional regulator/GNAT family N-acetyltransferase n=1 Tax=Rhodoplanes sp. Z2-YC6860 TaxID=674703 RepID=UPI00078D4531|nr:bifunctional helix-turn-helix transcriptional regulator/GNAT family N-acetyltransferase [Rhodoplanes sp. Z2-YC6860]AMN40946.1 transcriptional regulator, MarR family with acetyltransferase activity [Rhodoplanes sp. Z2-YC6860]